LSCKVPCAIFFGPGSERKRELPYVENDLESCACRRDSGNGCVLLDSIFCGEKEEDGGGARDLRRMAIQNGCMQQPRLVLDAAVRRGRQVVSVAYGLLATRLPEVMASNA
jgi:hypothetical protein